MPFDPHLADLMRAAVKAHGFQERKMFGGYCWMSNGNMVCGVEVARFMFRVGKEQQAHALERAGAVPVVFSGRPMGGFVWVDADAALEAGLQEWIALAMRFVGTLPPK